MFLNHLVKKFADIVNLTENFDNFVFCNHSVVLPNHKNNNIFRIINKLNSMI